MTRFFSSTWAKAALLALLLVPLAGAATLEDYRVRIAEAQVSMDKLLAGSATAGDSPEAFAAHLKQLIPATERVEWPTGSIETDNRWLHAGLDDWAAASLADRPVLADSIRSRLIAITSALDGDAADLSVETKDEQKRRLAEILARQEYQKPAPKSESAFQRWWRELMEWLARSAPVRPDLTPSGSGGVRYLHLILQVIIFALVIGLIGIVVYKFVPIVRGRLAGRQRGISEDRLIMGEIISPDETAVSLFTEAEQLAKQGDLRMAIRKGYIALLCELSDRKVVKLSRHKTNRDYLKDIRDRRLLLHNVRGLTGSFEVNWYGLRPMVFDDWERFRDSYNRAMSDLETSDK